MRQSQKLGNAFKTTYLSVLIMGWRISCSCRHSMTGSTTVLMKPWMLSLEEHSYHLISLKPLLLWKRWPPIKVWVKKELRPAREVEETPAQGGRHASCQDGPANEEAWWKSSTGGREEPKPLSTSSTTTPFEKVLTPPSVHHHVQVC